VGLILAAQKVEHYEIATYGGLHQLALTMGHDDVASVLEETLNEEKEADSLLTSIAENNVNYEANTEK
jgi:ferritin-like metal-binding protein YciE